ncbi:hypothetical protein CNMCM7691_009396 [Aspergillus felis]|uniref:Uncharacterized protein n=1 Tax=Aspergillus felis TaxID=1287682 RepID=A0A8H6QWV6_9EURO|nr:hypothetical protein CNMCM7691_009396 [Aspergillus felis]
MYTAFVQKLYLLLLVGLFLTWQVLTHPVHGESHARSLISATLEPSGPAALHVRGGKICGLSCGRVKGGDGESESGGSPRGGNNMQLQPHNNQGNPAAIGAPSLTYALYAEAKGNTNFFVHTGHSRFWEINRSQRQVYSTGVCTGCTVAVVASGRGIYLHHFREESGNSMPFANPESPGFVTHVSGPFDEGIHANSRAFDGQRPYMVVATIPQYRNAVNHLEDIFLRKFNDGIVRIQPYSRRILDNDENDNTPFGKVVVQWLPPPSNGGDHRLIVRVEENVVLDAHYNADDLLNLIQGIPHVAPLLNSEHIQAHDENGHTILYHIVEQGLKHLIKPLTKWIPQSSIPNNEGWTPLHQAVRNGDEPMIKALVYAGSDILAKDNRGKTALHLACDEDAVSIVQILLDHGADPSAVDCEGRTPLHEGFGRNTVILQKLIKAGADLNPRRMPLGLTPLYYEAWLGREDAVRILLEAGADPSIQTETGETILQRAIKGSHTKVVRLLLDAGVDVNVRDFRYGVNAILTAASWGADDCIRLLQRAGADVFAVDHRGCNGLHLAAMAGKLSTVQLLLKEGFDSSAEDDRGYTPLRHAVEGKERHSGLNDRDYEAVIRILEDVHKSPFLRLLHRIRQMLLYKKELK